jgi:hypothetical protein
MVNGNNNAKKFADASKVIGVLAADWRKEIYNLET